jgi:hypothetical protein
VSCSEVFEQGWMWGGHWNNVWGWWENEKVMWQQTNMFDKHMECVDSEGYMMSIIVMANKAFVVQWFIAAIIVSHEIECSIPSCCNLFFLIIIMINKGKL